MKQLSRPVLWALALVGVLASVLVGTSADATLTCKWVGTGLNYHQACVGIRHEVIAAKVDRGSSAWYQGKIQNQDPSLYFNGRLTDKAADGHCTSVRVVATNAYWPPSNPNVEAERAWRICGAGTSKVIGIDLHGAWAYPKTTIKIQHCAWTGGSSGRMYCETFFQRTFPE